jgi:hypothetical protein
MALERFEESLPGPYRFPSLANLNAPSAQTLKILGLAAPHLLLDETTPTKQQLRYEVLAKDIFEHPSISRRQHMPNLPSPCAPNQHAQNPNHHVHLPVQPHPLTDHPASSPAPSEELLLDACRWASGYAVVAAPPPSLQAVLRALLLEHFPAYWYAADGWARPDRAPVFAPAYLAMLRAPRFPSPDHAARRARWRRERVAACVGGGEGEEARRDRDIDELIAKLTDDLGLGEEGRDGGGEVENRGETQVGIREEKHERD